MSLLFAEWVILPGLNGICDVPFLFIVLCYLPHKLCYLTQSLIPTYPSESRIKQDNSFKLNYNILPVIKVFIRKSQILHQYHMYSQVSVGISGWCIPVRRK